MTCTNTIQYCRSISMRTWAPVGVPARRRPADPVHRDMNHTFGVKGLNTECHASIAGAHGPQVYQIDGCAARSLRQVQPVKAARAAHHPAGWHLAVRCSEGECSRLMASAVPPAAVPNSSGSLCVAPVVHGSTLARWEARLGYGPTRRWPVSADSAQGPRLASRPLSAQLRCP